MVIFILTIFKVSTKTDRNNNVIYVAVTKNARKECLCAEELQIHMHPLTDKEIA